MKITLTKAVLILGCLIVSDMMFNWGLPLGGLLFLLWLILAGINFLYLEDKCKTAGVKTFIGQKLAWTYVCIVGIAMIWELKAHLILLGGIILAIGLIKKQFIRRFEGELQEKESWLGELSELIKTDKSSLRTMLSDRKPKETIDPDKLRMQYVKELTIRTKQGRVYC